jgi:hypothetical protein
MLTAPEAGILANFSHSGVTVVLWAPRRPPAQFASSSRVKVRTVTPGVVDGDGLAEVGDADVVEGSGVGDDAVGLEVGVVALEVGVVPVPVEHAVSASAPTATTTQRAGLMVVLPPYDVGRPPPASLTPSAVARRTRRACG